MLAVIDGSLAGRNWLVGNFSLADVAFAPRIVILPALGVTVDPEWRKRPRPVGIYISTGWVPGNFLAEGALSVCATIMTLKPEILRADLIDAVLFQVVDCLTADDTARGLRQL